MEISWLSLIPPCIAIITALIIHNINISLLLGIASASLIACNGSIEKSLLLIANRSWGEITSSEKAYLYLFLIVISCLVSVFNHNGCINSFAHFVSKHIKSFRALQTSSMLISLSLFIDDYLSILATGFIMSPLTDRFGIPRQKLAYLVHSLAGPLVILAPISSWVGAITTYMHDSGINSLASEDIHILADPFFVYLGTIPFIFYSFLTIGSTWFIVHNHISYGPMRFYEQTQQPKPINTTSSLLPEHYPPIGDLFLPLIVILVGTFFGILYSGNYYFLGGTLSLLEAIKQSNDLCLVLFLASVAALVSSLFLSFAHRTISWKQLPALFIEGSTLMCPVIIMLFLAAVFGAMLKSDLFTGHYLATSLLSNIPIALLPAMFFIATITITIATGSAWAAIALMLPIALPMLITVLQLTESIDPVQIPILFPLLGAIFSGAVCGDHLSPIGGSTVMTASSTGVAPLIHAYTQFFYALPSLLCTILAFLLSGYCIQYPLWINCLISLGTSTLLCFIILWLLHKHTLKHRAS
ncbi:MAG: hypothetical protein NT124_03385 [Candidatus Dependentiae bacterium]|nr:hypothetical protein [Candidatus Dependentiae bacterium]